MTDPQVTDPPEGSQASVEDLEWTVDTTANLTGNQTPTAVTAKLYPGSSAPFVNPITLADAPTVTGNVLAQVIRAGVLSPASATSVGVYTLIFTYTPSGTTNVYAARTTIHCPF